MPSYFQVYPEDHLVSVALWGAVSLPTLQGLLANNTDSASVTNSYDFLIDLTGVKEVSLSFADMQNFVDLQNLVLAGRVNTAKTALYAPDDLTYGFARMYVSIGAEISSRPTAVFRSQSSLFNFLDRAPDPDLFPKVPKTHNTD